MWTNIYHVHSGKVEPLSPGLLHKDSGSKSPALWDQGSRDIQGYRKALLGQPLLIIHSAH